MKVEIELRKETKDQIGQLVKEGKYHDVDDFINRAAETLLMAEERIKLMGDFVKKQ